MRGVISHIIVALLLMGLALPVAGLDKPEVAFGMVQDLDKGLGHLHILTPAGETVSWPVGSTMLKGVAPGDLVKVELRKGRVTRLEKAALI